MYVQGEACNSGMHHFVVSFAIYQTVFLVLRSVIFSLTCSGIYERFQTA